MFRTRFIFGLSVLFLAAGIVVTAQGQGTGSKTSYKTAPAPHPSSAPLSSKTQTSKATTTKSAAATPSKSAPAKTPKADKTVPMSTAKATTKPAKSDKPVDTKLAKADKPAKATKSTSTSSSKSTKTTASTTTPPAPLTPVQLKLKENATLAAKVASRLPQGTDVIAAAAGFKTLGQFIAAANVANNLQLSFTELKAKMMTGMSLGQAIQAVRPLTASPTVEAQRAEYDARGMISESEQTTPSTSSGSTPTKLQPPASSTTPSSPTQKSKAKPRSSAQ